MLLRARIVLPISRPPIENGGLFISENRIVAVGLWPEIRKEFKGEVVDLGDSILMPGLINAHCHLDYTNMAGHITPSKSFADWIKAMLALKASWSYSEYAESWLSGARLLLETGTTMVADIEAVPELLPDVWLGTPLRIYSFLEMTGLKSERVPAEIVDDALRRIDAITEHVNSVGLSPHALYSTKPVLLQLAAKAARSRGLRLTTHVAESREEVEMYQHRQGSLFDWLKTQRDMSDCEGASPVRVLANAGLLTPEFLAVHVNNLADDDANILGRQGASVVHCPSSHAYFQHETFRYRDLVDARVNVCLGTDSRASIKHSKREPAPLSMFTEMQQFAAAHPTVAPAEILRMATLNGAKALGFENQLGEIISGAFADAIVIPFTVAAASCEESAMNFTGNVAASMINGRWAIAPQVR
jgi:cytosine/adenosine deaminase-related metal-dependent hydrolase